MVARGGDAAQPHTEGIESMAARGGIEPPTRGFSIRRILRPASPKVTQLVFRQLRPYGRCWKMILSDAGLETKVETRVVPCSAKKRKFS